MRGLQVSLARVSLTTASLSILEVVALLFLFYVFVVLVSPGLIDALLYSIFLIQDDASLV